MPTIINGTSSAITFPDSSVQNTAVTSPTVVGQIPFSTNGTSYTATDKIVSGTAVASTSGTSIDFTGIPSWVKRVTVVFNGVSTNGTSNILIQIGSGSVLTSGYGSSAIYGGTSTGGSSSTAGFIATTASSSGVDLSGTNIITLFGSNTYVSTGNLIYNSASPILFVLSSTGIRTSVGGAIDRVRITTVNGTDTFDAGSINILYE